MNKIPVLILIIAFLSCNESNIQSPLGIKVQSTCHGKTTCVVEFSSILDESWDKFYIFKESASLEYINNTLGFRYPYFEDIGKRFIFIKNDSIIYHEDIFPSIAPLYDYELVFDLPDSSKYASFIPQTAVFEVTETKSGTKTILKARPILK